jgi:GntR family transcriptional regulator
VSVLDWSGSLLELLARHGYRFVTTVARISAVTLPSDVGRRNNLRANDPWLLITETCVSESGEPLLFSKNYHRSDVFAFNVIRRRVDNIT